MKHMLRLLGLVLALTACDPTSATQNPTPLAPNQQHQVKERTGVLGTPTPASGGSAMNILSSKPRGPKLFSRLSLYLLVMTTAALASSDGSLPSAQAAGVLKVCVPNNHPPLASILGKGLEVELAQAVAHQMKLKLQLSGNQGWELASLEEKVGRSECQLMAGGVMDQRWSRQQIELLPPFLEVGWAMVYSPKVASLKGSKVAVYLSFVGLDRLALSQYLKRQQAQIILVGSPQAFRQALISGQAQVGISEALLARNLAAKHSWKVAWVPIHQSRFALGLLGIWKNDRALKKEVTKAIQALERSGQMQALFERYKLAAISERCGIC